MTMSPMRRGRMSRTLRGEAESVFGRSFRFNGGLVDQHDRNVVLDSVNAKAAEALQAFLVGGELHFRFAERAGQDFEELGVKRHGGLLNIGGAAIYTRPPAIVNQENLTELIRQPTGEF